MTLRERHTSLHQHLTSVLARVDWDNASDRAEIALLLREAAEAILACPVEGCAYCWNVTQPQREERP